jgi:hypothetical protein
MMAAKQKAEEDVLVVPKEEPAPGPEPVQEKQAEPQTGKAKKEKDPYPPMVGKKDPHFPPLAVRREVLNVTNEKRLIKWGKTLDALVETKEDAVRAILMHEYGEE